MYTDRSVYQRRIDQNELDYFACRYKSAHLYVGVNKDKELLNKIFSDALFSSYSQIEVYIAKNPGFETSLVPVVQDLAAPDIIKDMINASISADVGPMAAVAGAVAKYTAQDVFDDTHEFFIENGGDILISTQNKKTIAIYAGESKLNLAAGILLGSGLFGVCTSAGKIGPSLSFGNADAAVCVSKDICLSDACATSLGNMLKSYKDIEYALDKICSINGIIGCVCIIENRIGFLGDIEVVRLC